MKKIGGTLTLRRQMNERKLNYFGHVTRHECLENSIAHGQVPGRRRKGRPPVSWLDDVKSVSNGNLMDAYRLAYDRDGWRAAVKSTQTPTGVT